MKFARRQNQQEPREIHSSGESRLLPVEPEPEVLMNGTPKLASSQRLYSDLCNFPRLPNPCKVW